MNSRKMDFRFTEFCELRHYGVLGSWQHLAPALRGVDFIRQAQE